jgi:hypothetical protein
MKTTSDIRERKKKKILKNKNMEISESLLEDLKRDTRISINHKYRYNIR